MMSNYAGTRTRGAGAGRVAVIGSSCTERRHRTLPVKAKLHFKNQLPLKSRIFVSYASFL